MIEKENDLCALAEKLLLSRREKRKKILPFLVGTIPGWKGKTSMLLVRRRRSEQCHRSMSKRPLRFCKRSLHISFMPLDLCHFQWRSYICDFWWAICVLKEERGIGEVVIHPGGFLVADSETMERATAA